MYNYPLKDYNKDHMARCVGINLPISRKISIEICNFLKGKKISLAKEDLGQVIRKKKAVPITRFNKGTGHKKKIGPGKYPINASREILGLIESVEANAQFKGLNTSDLIIYHISASKGATQWHYGRQRRRQMKRTNVVVVVKEETPANKKSKEITDVKKKVSRKDKK
jgi:large subunit ribosomal protein L22